MQSAALAGLNVNYTALSLAQTPPLFVPLRYFLTAPLFMMLSGVILLFSGPETLDSRWSPAMLAMTHCWVLGMLAMVMFGAMKQLLPVLIGVPVWRAQCVSVVLHIVLTCGSLALIFSLWWDLEWLMPISAALLGVAVTAFTSVAFISLFKSPSSHATGLAMRFALLGLLVTAGLGITLLLGHSGMIPVARQLTDIHAGWGLLVWVGLLLAGVAYQVVPMFQITPNYPRLMMRAFTPLVFSLMVLWGVVQWQAGDGLIGDILSLILAGCWAAFAVTTLILQQKRRRRLPDVTLSFWRLSMISLLVTVALWLGRSFAGLPVPDLILGVVMVAGFIVSAIMGMLYKIVPFLVWLHLNNQVQQAGFWQGSIPNMKQVIPEQVARRQFRLYLSTLLCLILAAGQPAWFAYPAAVLVIASALLLWWHILGAVRIYYSKISEMRETAQPD